MRTSNKLILGFIVFVFGSFLSINAVLRHKYSKGEFVAQEALWQESFVNHPLPKPRVIVLEGAIWVNLIPGDSFVLAMPRVNRDPDAGMFKYEVVLKSKSERARDQAITYDQRGDTLYITGTVQVPIHRPYSEWFYRRGLPVVDIYASSFDNILLDHGQVCLRGGRSGAGRPAHLTVVNSTLWIGMQYSTYRHDPTESFDSLDITSINSDIVVNSVAQLSHFSAQLKDSSILIDQYFSIDTANILASPNSTIHLSGENLKKCRITVQ
jgi:hypothetical protein